MNRQKNLYTEYTFFFILFILTGEILLLFYRTKPFTDHPLWFYACVFSIIFSLALIFFAGKEIDKQKKYAEKKESILNERIVNTSELLKETHALYREKIKHLEMECEKLHQINAEAQKQFEKNLDEEKINANQILEETNLYKTRCVDLQNSLNDAIDELRKEREQCFLLKEQQNQQKTSQESSGHYKQLREQFEEKSAVLDATRKEFFLLEGQFIALQKQKQFEILENDSKQEILVKLLEELDQQKYLLEKEVLALEAIISNLMAKKKTSRKSKKSENLELQFAEQQI